VHGLGIESTKFLDMTYGGVFVHCTVEEGKSILDRILSITPLEDLQIKPPLIFEDEPIITYPDTSDISALPVREEFLQLTAPGIGLKNEIEDPTPFPLSIKEDCCKVSRFGGSKGRFAVASKVFHDSKIICCRF
jgi:hypothetical protein